MMRKFLSILMLGFVALGVISCGQEKSATTGWNYNDPKYGGFEKADFQEQETGPNLVFVKGGTFVMGQREQSMEFGIDNLPRRVTIRSFYMDETEVSNIDYREYLYWIRRVYVDYPEVYREALPDTFGWRSPLAFNEPYVKYYFRHPAYNFYPVVNVSWVQATNYTAWRADRVNEFVMIRDGYIESNPDQINEDNFNTEAYLANQYDPIVKKEIESKNPNQQTRRIQMEDGILLPDYRLPTEAEWEYAASALVGESLFENVNTDKVYPWKGLQLRQMEGHYRGKFIPNFRRGRGDLMGVASELNDASDILAPIRSYWPNDYGLYHMAGNASEWVADVYRPLSFEDVNDFNPYRGNIFQVAERDEDGYLQEKDSLGRIKYRDVTREENVDRLNYQEADNRGSVDPMDYNEGLQKYDYGVATLINNEARVYKGGSWNDRAYWLSPGSRRFLDQERSMPTLSFRCAMIRVGPTQNEMD